MANNKHDERVRCARCGDVVGVYEPLVVIDAQGARQTSYAAEPELIGRDGERFHCACHATGVFDRDPLATRE